MERRTFSIEPYVNASGIMSGEIEVDEKAADSIMKRTALRRDVLVDKGFYRDQYHVVGSEELAIETSRAKQQGSSVEIGQSLLSSLDKTADVWVIRIHDQQIGDKVNEWMDKHFKADPKNPAKGQQDYKKRFVGELNSQVADRLRNAFWDEKKIIFASSVKNSILWSTSITGRIVVPVFWISYVSSNMFRQILLHQGELVPPFPYVMAIGGPTSVALIIASAVAEQNITDNLSISEITRESELFFPNPQIPSLVLGNAALLLNSHKLIKLKQK